MIRTAAQGDRDPARTLMRANEMILKNRRSELLLTAFYAVLDTRSGQLVYTSAGHTRPLWYQAATGELQELAARGFILGAFQGIELEEREIVMAPGDLVVFYTDGVTEAMDASRELFDEERLRAVVAANSGASAQQVLDAIVDAVRGFTGDLPQSDDLTLLVVRRSPSNI
jgi:sigma-B regulation protein RsbU (phosphoserine phosphatase)